MPTPRQVPPLAELPSGPSEMADEEYAGATAFDYLQTPQGHEVAKRLLGILERIANAKVDRDATAIRLERLVQIGIIVLVVAASTTLAIADKFNATIGLLFGTLVGYVLSPPYSVALVPAYAGREA